MRPAQIAALLRPYLSLCHSSPAFFAGEESALFQNISTYIDILLRWNARINLTAIRSEEEIVTRHFGESLFAATHLFPSSSSVPALSEAEGSSVSSVVKAFDSDFDFDFANDQRPTTDDVPPARSSKPEAPRLADLGSGSGFPGIPIKLWAPQIQLTLIESNQKKSSFLREIARALTLTNVNIQNTRAESLTQEFDVVTLRAVERFDKILPTAARLVCPGGRLALLIGSSQADQAQSGLPHLLWQPPIPIPNSASRILQIAHVEPKHHSLNI